MTKTVSLTDHDLRAIEAATARIGRELFDRMKSPRTTVFNRQWRDDRLMQWAMRDEAVKVQMFRFVDVLPMLRDADSVVGHLREYFAEVRDSLPRVVRWGMALARPGGWIGRMVAASAKRNASANARRFIAGVNVDEVLAAAQKQRRLRRAFTIDVLGEAVVSETEADAYLQAYVDLIRRMAPTVNGWPEQPQLDRDPRGELPRVNVSVKLSALDSHFDPIAPEATTDRVARRLRELLRTAREHRAFVNVDMESYHYKDLTLHVFKQVLMEDEFRDSADVGIVVQCYLRDARRDLISLRDWAIERGTPVWVRLVKGAYWDYETAHAQATGWPIPVFQQKWESDATFEWATRFTMQTADVLRPALGSHNVRSLAHGLAVAEHLGLPNDGFEIQMLYGMGDEEKEAICALGHRLRIYMPYGELIPGMAYLVRRLLENTSNDSFLRASFAEHAPPEKLLADPLLHAADYHENKPRTEWENPLTPPQPNSSQSAKTPATAAPPAATGSFTPTYHCEPPTDFSIAEKREAMKKALAETARQFGRHEPLWIGGEAVDTADRITSVNPSRKDQIIGTTASADRSHAELAVAAARKALPGWAGTDVAKRADYLRRAAAEMRKRKFELAAWMVYEAGKTWPEADGDVAEAIDFCEYYAQGAETMHAEQGVDVPGEENRFEFLPRGVVGVIAPWNFPLAILTGMTVAALATGNTVVMKPAEQTSLVGARLSEVFRSIDLPPGVLNFLPGDGATAGAALVEHPHTALIAFTGSREVGLAINARAAQASVAGSPNVKRVIAEMGGKNAIIVDADADLDEAVLGVAKSAFGFQGQKCSACSRCIVVGDAYDVFLSRFLDVTRSLRLGSADDPATMVGPVIDEEARAKILRYVEIGRSESRLALGVDAAALAEQGFFVGPHVFADVAPNARIAREEIFGPVLAVIRAADISEAIAIANDSDYALTGGIFSRSPANLDRVRKELMVGNLYVNRSITGALVSRQPFGGFKMSGIGGKAGGPDYLYQFVVSRTITENTMRRGFAPTTAGAPTASSANR
jgi:RHH-type proline utilization regulon transcriptional repressor/proline dehydrogenase/delta 1-pyrroline-5-carboxylate dehydrogenase